MLVHRDDSVQTALMRDTTGQYMISCGKEREMACEACCVEGMLSVLREPSLVLIESLRTSQKSDSSAKINSLVSYARASLIIGIAAARQRCCAALASVACLLI